MDYEFPGQTDAVASLPVSGMLECRVCGHGPAADVVLRAHRGYIAMVRVVAETGPYCRDCGLAVFREVTAETMLHGWWSIVSWAVAPAVMLLNLRARRAVRRLPEPARLSEPHSRVRLASASRPPLSAARPDSLLSHPPLSAARPDSLPSHPPGNLYVAPNMRPLPPGRPVFARPQSWAGLVLLSVLATTIGVLAARQSPEPEPGCVRFSETLRVQHAQLVDCAEPHEARVLDEVTEWSACPPETTRLAVVGPRLYCLVDEMVSTSRS